MFYIQIVNKWIIYKKHIFKQIMYKFNNKIQKDLNNNIGQIKQMEYLMEDSLFHKIHNKWKYL